MGADCTDPNCPEAWHNRDQTWPQVQCESSNVSRAQRYFFGARMDAEGVSADVRSTSSSRFATEPLYTSAKVIYGDIAL